MTNNMNQNQRKAIEKALVQMKAARGNLLLVVILTAINIIMYASGSDNMFLFSTTIPYSIAVAGMLTETVQISVIGIVFALLINAVVGEHNISAGFAGVHSFIAVDGEKVAKKLRIA